MISTIRVKIIKILAFWSPDKFLVFLLFQCSVEGRWLVCWTDCPQPHCPLHPWEGVTVRYGGSWGIVHGSLGGSTCCQPAWIFYNLCTRIPVDPIPT